MKATVLKTLLSVSWAALILGGLSIAHADGTQVFGGSPTGYTPLLDGGSDELDAFTKLQQLRDSGKISPKEYQQRIMALAFSNKAGMRSTGSDNSGGDHAIEMPLPPTVPVAPTYTAPPTQPSSPFVEPPLPESFPQTATPPTRTNPMDQILRPSGNIPSYTLKDVSDN